MSTPGTPGSDLASDLARKVAEFDILQRLSGEINSTLELDEIYEAALRTMGELFDFHHAIILLLEDDGETLTVVASRGYENQAVGGRVKVGTGVIGTAAKRRKLLHLDNLGQYRSYISAQRREMIKAGRGAEIAEAMPVPGLPNAESQIALPLVVKDTLIGVFSIESPVRRSFSEHDRALVTIVANHIASAIQRRDWQPVIQFDTGPHAHDAVPTVEHYLPLLYVAGAAHDDEPVMMSSFQRATLEFASMRSIRFG